MQAFGAQQHPVIRVFLNGFNLDRRSGALQVSAAPTNLQGTKLTIKVTMGKKTLIDKICLSWIAFSPSTASFVSYGGQVSKSKFSGAISKDISSTIYQSSYTIYGLNLISIISGKGISFASEISNDFVFSLSSSIPIDSFSLVYIAIGPYPSKVCANCGAQNIINGNVCVASCPAGTFAYTYKDGGVACRTCPKALGLILVGGKCVKGSTTTTTTTTTTVVTKKPIVKPPMKPVVKPPMKPVVPMKPVTPAPKPVTHTSTQTQTQQTTQTNTQRTTQTSTQQTNTQKTTQTNTQQTNTQQTLDKSTNTQTNTQTSTQQTSTPAQQTPQQVSPPQCPDNSYFNGNECVCEVGFVFADG